MSADPGAATDPRYEGGCEASQLLGDPSALPIFPALCVVFHSASSLYALDKGHTRLYLYVCKAKPNGRKGNMTTTKHPITEHLSDAERLTLLSFSQEYRSGLDVETDPVDATLFAALEKLDACLRLSSEW